MPQLIAVDDIAGVVDLQGDRCRLARMLSIHAPTTV
jgi:hypothetical protein